MDKHHAKNPRSFIHRTSTRQFLTATCHGTDPQPTFYRNKMILAKKYNIYLYKIVHNLIFIKDHLKGVLCLMLRD